MCFCNSWLVPEWGLPFHLKVWHRIFNVSSEYFYIKQLQERQAGWKLF